MLVLNLRKIILPAKESIKEYDYWEIYWHGDKWTKRGHVQNLNSLNWAKFRLKTSAKKKRRKHLVENFSCLIFFMADDSQFSNLLTSLLSIDNDARTQAEVNIITYSWMCVSKKSFKKSIKKCASMKLRKNVLPKYFITMKKEENCRFPVCLIVSYLA